MAESSKWKIPVEHIESIMENAEYIELDCFGSCTVVIMKMPNGFVLVEKAGTIDPSGYDPKLGRHICYEKLKDKVWELEGYIQKCRWSMSLDSAHGEGE